MIPARPCSNRTVRWHITERLILGSSVINMLNRVCMLNISTKDFLSTVSDMEGLHRKSVLWVGVHNAWRNQWMSERFWVHNGYGQLPNYWGLFSRLLGNIMVGWEETLLGFIMAKVNSIRHAKNTWMVSRSVMVCAICAISAAQYFVLKLRRSQVTIHEIISIN